MPRQILRRQRAIYNIDPTGQPDCPSGLGQTAEVRPVRLRGELKGPSRMRRGNIFAQTSSLPETGRQRTSRYY